MNKPSVLITSPSINPSINVSGIANLTRLLLLKNNGVNYRHFRVGKKDEQRRDIYWFFSQFLVLSRYISVLLFEKSIRICHINIPMSKLAIYMNLLLVVISKIFRKKIIVHFRGGSLSLNENISGVEKFIIGLCIKFSNKVILLGKKEYHFIKSFYGLTISEKYVILPNAVEIPESSSENCTCEKEKGPLNIVFIGRLDRNKGLEEILNSLKELVSFMTFHFYVAGTGQDKDWFLGECHRCIGSHFTYRGVLDNSEKSDLYRGADIFLLPSYFEGLPNALLEAMAFRVVPIVTGVGSIPEVVIDGKNGFIVPLRDYKSILKNVCILNDDRDLMERIKNAAHSDMLQNYSFDKYMIKLNGLYSSLNNK